MHLFLLLPATISLTLIGLTHAGTIKNIEEPTLERRWPEMTKNEAKWVMCIESYYSQRRPAPRNDDFIAYGNAVAYCGTKFHPGNWYTWNRVYKEHQPLDNVWPSPDLLVEAQMIANSK
ncbi:hypothetical protein F4779DRAFT_572367 [Xylariaceae sp. FL0662B]|nr:hypothetical protein F4779DRAFT_572367 [Xylariaceae sp. FL0662B]